MAKKWFCFFAKLNKTDTEKVPVMIHYHEENFESIDGKIEPYQTYCVNNNVGELADVFEPEVVIQTEAEFKAYRNKIISGKITKIDSSGKKVDEDLSTYKTAMENKFPANPTMWKPLEPGFDPGMILPYHEKIKRYVVFAKPSGTLLQEVLNPPKDDAVQFTRDSWPKQELGDLEAFLLTESQWTERDTAKKNNLQWRLVGGVFIDIDWVDWEKDIKTFTESL